MVHILEDNSNRFDSWNHPNLVESHLTWEDFLREMIWTFDLFLLFSNGDAFVCPNYLELMALQLQQRRLLVITNICLKIYIYLISHYFFLAFCPSKIVKWEVYLKLVVRAEVPLPSL